MSIIEAGSGASQTEKISFKRRIMETGVGRAAIRIGTPWLIEQGNALFDVEPDVINNVELLRESLEAGYKLVIISNHQTQADVAPVVKVANLVRNKFPDDIEGFDFIVAKSMGDGKQGKTVELLFAEGVNPWLRNQDINPIEVVSRNDVEVRNMQRSTDAIRLIFESLKKDRTSLIVFPEGNTTGGKRNDAGELNGVGEMDPGLSSLISRIVDRSMPVVFLPVGLDGSYELFDPNSKSFTKHGMNLMITHGIFALDRTDLSVRVGTIGVGKPFLASEIAGSEDPGREIMRRIAQLVPEEARGIFK